MTTPITKGPARLILALVLVALTGCHAVRHETRLPAGGRQLEHRVDFLVLGAVGSEEVNLDSYCPDGVHAFGSEVTLVDSLLTIVTLGIYAPRTVKVECAGTP